MGVTTTDYLVTIKAYNDFASDSINSVWRLHSANKDYADGFSIVFNSGKRGTVQADLFGSRYKFGGISPAFRIA